MASNCPTLVVLQSLAVVMRRLIFAGGMIVCAAGTAGAQSAPPSNDDLVKEGAVIAERLCSSCHVLANAGSAGTAREGPPTFKGIANRPEQTATRIRNVLIMPHAPMPDVRLSHPEIERLIAYIDSLRSADAGPPLAPRRSPGAKPEYPDPT